MMTDEGKIGILYPPGNEEGLYRALEQSLLLNLSEERKRVLDWFVSNLSAQANAKKIMDVLESR
jgi:hypothetical protein